MWHIQKIDPADLIVDTQYVAFVGAGGKTSLIEYLAGETVKKKQKDNHHDNNKNIRPGTLYVAHTKQRQYIMPQIIRYGSAKPLKTASSRQ